MLCVSSFHLRYLILHKRKLPNEHIECVECVCVYCVARGIDRKPCINFIRRLRHIFICLAFANAVASHSIYFSPFINHIYKVLKEKKIEKKKILIKVAVDTFAIGTNDE